MELYSTEYLTVYLKEAEDIGVVTSDEAKEYRKIWDDIMERDAQLSSNLKIKLPINRKKKKIKRLEKKIEKLEAKLV